MNNLESGESGLKTTGFSTLDTATCFMLDDPLCAINRFCNEKFLHSEPLPEPWNAKLDTFQKLLVLKCLRADKVTNAMQVRNTPTI